MMFREFGRAFDRNQDNKDSFKKIHFLHKEEEVSPNHYGVATQANAAASAKRSGRPGTASASNQIKKKFIHIKAQDHAKGTQWVSRFERLFVETFASSDDASERRVALSRQDQAGLDAFSI
jgi:hypothetical protein